MEKWIALALVAVGFALVIHACRNSNASYESGAFLMVILSFLAGCGLMGAGVVIFIVLLFRAL